MAASPIRAVIFDCDGTLVDSETVSMRVLVEYVAEFGATIPLEEAMQRFAGGELPKVFSEVENQLGKPLPADHIDQFRVRQLAALRNRLDAMDGAADVLESLTLPFCIASNAPRNKVQICLETTGLDQFVEKDKIFSAYDIRVWKPEPDLFLMAAEALGIEPAECAVIEDSEFGVDAGIAAGMTVFAFDPHKTREWRSGVRVIHSLRELIGAF